jgi:phage portal protein BeeE
VNLLSRLRGGREAERYSLEDYIQQSSFAFNGLSYGLSGPLGPGIQQTLNGTATEMAPTTFAGLATHAYASNGVVFACMMVRQLAFSGVRFSWQRLRDGKPSDLYATPALRVLETPWPGGTTQDLLSRLIQDADLAGNSYWTLQGGELVRLRPDWVQIAVEEIYTPDGRGPIGWRKAGYVYTERCGTPNEATPVGFMADEVAHFAPIPDPTAVYRGMSWLTPVVREIQADQAMTRHQTKFFDNGATVSMVIKHDAGATQEKVEKWVEQFQDKHAGPQNAYKTMHLYPGADVTPVGSSFKDIEFAATREGGEVRIAAAANVPPVIVGLSKGLDSATYSNYGQARRRFADGTVHPLWQNAAGSMQQIIKPPDTGSRLWYDARDVPFLREDEADAAAIQSTRAGTIFSLISSGFEPMSAVSAVEANDFSGLLKHTGMTSVQLQVPGQSTTPTQAATNGQSQGGSTNGE